MKFPSFVRPGRLRRRSADRQSFLTPDGGDTNTAPPRSSLDKVADALAALQAGKLPSQDQINAFLQALSRSAVLSADDGESGGIESQLVGDLRELVQASLRIGLEKNQDDKLQDFIFQCSRLEASSIELETLNALGASQSAKEQRELQAESLTFTNAIKSVSKMALTSAAFRVLLSDILSSARGLVQHIATAVADVAQKVEITTETVQKTAKIGGGSLEEVQEELVTVSEAEDSLNTRDIFIGKIQQLLIRAHQDPESLHALQMLHYLLRKYVGALALPSAALSSVSSPTSLEELPSNNSSGFRTDLISKDLKTLLERLASGHSLDPAILSFQASCESLSVQLSQPSSDVNATLKQTKLKQYFADLDLWLSRSFASSQGQLYAISPSGTRALESLYDEGQVLFISQKADPVSQSWTSHFKTFLDNCKDFLSSLSADRATARFMEAFNKFKSTLAEYVKKRIIAGLGSRLEWQKDLVEVILGYLLQIITKIPITIPKIEFKNDNIEVTLDPLLRLDAKKVTFKLKPDHLTIKNLNEIAVDWQNGHAQTSSSAASQDRNDSPMTTTSNSIQIHLDGIRLSLQEIGYFFGYKGRILKYSDQGLISLNLGSSSKNTDTQSQGLCFDIDIQLESSSTPRATAALTGIDGGDAVVAANSEHRYFEVKDVRVSIIGLEFTLANTKHWLMNKLLQPLAGPIVSRILGRLLEKKIKELANKVGKAIWLLQAEAQSARRETTAEPGKQPTVIDYWKSVLRKGPNILRWFTTTAARADTTLDVYATTTVAFAGPVHASAVPPVEGTSTSESQPLQETIVALEISSQVMQEDARLAVGDLVPEVSDRTNEAEAEDMIPGKARRDVKDAIDLKGDFGQVAVETELEERTPSWRSSAFDL